MLNLLWLHNFIYPLTGLIDFNFESFTETSKLLSGLTLLFLQEMACIVIIQHRNRVIFLLIQFYLKT